MNAIYYTSSVLNIELCKRQAHQAYADCQQIMDYKSYV